MFSMLPTPAHTYDHTYYYPPAVSSPLSSSPLRRSLSPRSPNVPTSPRAFSSKSTMPRSPTPSKLTGASPQNSSVSSTSTRESAYSKRVTKVNPLIHGRSDSMGADGRETRRKLFLKKVREDSEDRRWKARGGDEEMMRSIWILEQRRREDKQRREAMGLDELFDEEDFLSLDEIMADEVALREAAELEALATMSTDEATHSLQSRLQGVPPEEDIDLLLFSTNEQDLTCAHVQPRPDALYGSDEDEYDRIFMDVIQKENRLAAQSSHALGEDDMMDMS